MVNINLIYPDVQDLARKKGRKEVTPLGVLYLASSLIKYGHKVSIINIPFTGQLPDSEVDAFAITSSCTFHLFKNFLKEHRNRKTLKIGGNTHVSLFPEEILNELDLDCAIVGEAEYSFPKFLSLYSEGRSLEYISQKVPGFFTKQEKEIFSFPKERIKNLDNLPFPARNLVSRDSLLLEDRIKGFDFPSLSVITSRGCPFSCSYCGNIYNGRVFYRSGKNVRMELLEIKEKYPEVKGIVFMDENLLLNKDHLLDVMKNINDLGFLFTVDSRAEHLTKNNAELLRESGCYEIKIGAESGSLQILKNMNKKSNIEDLEKALFATNSSGLKTKLFMMYGFPGESTTTTNETINFLRKNKKFINRVTLSCFSPLPGTDTFRNPQKYNIVIPNKDWEMYSVYPKQPKKWYKSEEDYETFLKNYSQLKCFISNEFPGS